MKWNIKNLNKREKQQRNARNIYILIRQWFKKVNRVIVIHIKEQLKLKEHGGILNIFCIF